MLSEVRKPERPGTAHTFPPAEETCDAIQAYLRDTHTTGDAINLAGDVAALL